MGCGEGYEPATEPGERVTGGRGAEGHDREDREQHDGDDETDGLEGEAHDVSPGVSKAGEQLCGIGTDVRVPAVPVAVMPDPQMMVDERKPAEGDQVVGFELLGRVDVHGDDVMHLAEEASPARFAGRVLLEV
jgi:hypothetical protein